MRTLVRAAAVAAIGALAGAVWVTFFYAAGPGLRLEFDRDLPRGVTGVYEAEFDEPTRLTFAWTGPEVTIKLPGLDRRQPWAGTFRLRGARPPGVPNPTVVFYADGLELHSVDAGPDFQDVDITIPPRPERPRGAVLTLRISQTFSVPSDPRALGVMLDRATLTPTTMVLPPAGALKGASVTGAAIGAAAALVGVTAGSAIGAAAVAAGGAAALIARGFGPHTNYPDAVATAAIDTGVALVLLLLVVEAAIGRPLRNTARFAGLFAGCTFLFRVLMVLHPDMPIGDAMFHAHRFQTVLAGNLYFTSTAPGGYQFPYAPGLYVFSAPFAGLVTRNSGDMALLRIVVLALDSVAAVLVYAMASRSWSRRIAAAIAAAVYLLLPLDFRVVTTGNLTNAFAQSLSVVALAVMTSPALRLNRYVHLAALTLVLAAAGMSHTSTFAILSVAGVCMAIMYFWKGGPALRSPALAVAVATLVAAAIAVAVYYAHFGETYRTEFARIGTETAAAAPDAGGRGIIARAKAVPYSLALMYGFPALAAAAFGIWRHRVRHSRDRLTLAMTGWLAASFLFLLLGVLTPVDFRYYLASIPALAAFAGFGAAELWDGRGPRRIVSVVLLLWIVWIGANTWWTTL